MASDPKPYRLYRGGRVKGKVPAPARPRRETPTDYRGPGAVPKRRRIGRGRLIALIALVLLLLVVVWAVASWFSVSSGVSDANGRLDPDARAALTHQSGLLFSHPTTILLMGTDNATVGGREGDRHSDSIMLLRTDPSHHRLYYLSIPRDLVVPIPGAATQKINAAFQIGGPALAIRTIHDYTGLPINHVVVVNFAAFKDLIDALGGVTIDVPAPIRSNRFDCPYATQARCDQWPGWRFAKGPQHMNGERALIYSRIRENQLNPSETDFTRSARQQAVLNAVTSKLTSVGTLLGLPFSGGSLVKPLTTDLSTAQLLQLGWLKFRSSSSSSVHCRLGGDFGGGGTGAPSEDNPTTIEMFLGKSAPQAPTGQFDPGCVIGHTLPQ
jgi:polyisoprenyl-teichoic acid--peptidoglycan teichoic acid transferase